MRSIKKSLAAALTAVAGLTVLPGVTAPAVADTPGCVSYGEFHNKVFLGDSQRRVHRVFDTSGVVEEKSRSGRNGRKLDVFRSYESCLYRDDFLWANFDDYSYGSPTRGGTLRLFAGQWTHYCLDYEDYYTGDWVWDDTVGDFVWDDFAIYDGSYCFDPQWEQEFWDDSLATRSTARPGKSDDGVDTEIEKHAGTRPAREVQRAG